MTQDTTPDYNALAAEVVTLMAAMRTAHHLPKQSTENHHPLTVADAASYGSSVHDHTTPHPFATSTETCTPAPHPPDPQLPAIAGDLMEIGRGSMGVLEALSCADKPATPGHIGHITGLSKGRVSNIIRGLEKKGYVEKSPSPTDNRSITVTLSTKGRQVTQRHHDALRAHIAFMLQQLGPKDAQDGVRVMRHLSQIIQANHKAPNAGCPHRPSSHEGQQVPPSPMSSSSHTRSTPPDPDASSTSCSVYGNANENATTEVGA